MKAAFSRRGFAIAALATAALAAGSRLAVLRDPLGRDAAACERARSVVAARGFATRGLLASGGLVVGAPHPVPVSEALEPASAPLFAWTTLGAVELFGLDAPRAVRVTEIAFIVLAALATLAIAARRAGALAGFLAGAVVVLASPSLSDPSSERLAADGIVLLLAALLDRFVASRALGPISLSSSVVLVGASLVGAFTGRLFLVDALLLGAASWIALDRDRRGLGVALVLAAPVLLSLTAYAAAERLSGAVSLLSGRGEVAPVGMGSLPGGLAAIPIGASLLAFLALTLRRPRASAIPLALAASAIPSALLEGGPGALRLSALAGLGAALLTGELLARSRVAGGAAALAIAALLAAAPRPAGARDAAIVEQLGRVARARVAFGESFATTEPSAPLAMALAERPVIAGVRSVERAKQVAELAASARFPCRWLLAPIDDAETAAVRSWLRSRYASSTEGPIEMFELLRPRTGSAPAAGPAAEIERLSDGRFELRLPESGGASAWRVEWGRRSLETLDARTVAGTPRVSALPASARAAEGLYVRATPLDAAGVAGPSGRESFVPPLGLRKLRSRTLLLIPLLAGMLAGAAFLLDRAFPRRS